MTDTFTPAQRRKWANGEIDRLIEIGVSPADAQQCVSVLLAMVPKGIDPATFELPALDLLARAEVTDADISDARAEVYADDLFPAEYKRLLDAIPEEG